MKRWKRLYSTSDSFVCPYCLKVFPLKQATRDHILPYSRFYDNSEKNIVLACKACNNEKGSLTPDEYAEWKTTKDIERWRWLNFIRNGGLSL